MSLFGVDFKEILIQFGLWAAVAIIFAESSVIFFLPGDSFLFAAGLLASQGYLNIYVLLLLCILAGITGNSTGYFIGAKLGRRLFKKDSFLFKQEYVDKSEGYFKKYGAMTIIMARYIPVVRTFAPIIAGIGDMSYITFVSYNIIGCVLWVSSMTLIGFFLGETVPNIDRYVLPIVLAIVFLSLLPALIMIVRNRYRQS